MPDHQEKKKIWHARCCAEASVAAQLSIIIPHYISAKFGNIFTNYKHQIFCQTRRLHTECTCITLATLAGISVKDWHWFAGSREVKCSGSRTGRRLITTIGVQYNRCKILDRCTKEQVLKYSTFESSTCMNKKKDIRKGSQRREFSFDKSRRQAGKHLLTNRFLFVCLLKIDPKMS